MCPLAFLFLDLWIKVDPYYSSWHNLIVSHTVSVQTSHMVTVLPGFGLSWLGAVVLLGFLWMQKHIWYCEWIALEPCNDTSCDPLVDLAVLYALFSGMFFWTSHEFSHTRVLHVCKFASVMSGLPSALQWSLILSYWLSCQAHVLGHSCMSPSLTHGMQHTPWHLGWKLCSSSPSCHYRFPELKQEQNVVTASRHHTEQRKKARPMVMPCAAMPLLSGGGWEGGMSGIVLSELDAFRM